MSSDKNELKLRRSESIMSSSPTKIAFKEKYKALNVEENCSDGVDEG